MAYSKVEYFGRTLIDLTEDTVTQESLAAGVTAHDKSGELIVGTGGSGGDILYFYQHPVSAATSAQIMRIPASGTNSAITTDTIVLECTFANPSYIMSNVSWRSYAGYIIFTGTCSAATTANVTLGQKSN